MMILELIPNIIWGITAGVALGILFSINARLLMIYQAIREVNWTVLNKKTD